MYFIIQLNASYVFSSSNPNEYLIVDATRTANARHVFRYSETYYFEFISDVIRSLNVTQKTRPELNYNKHLIAVDMWHSFSTFTYLF